MSEEDEVTKRIDKLIEKGGKVLDTYKPPSPGSVMATTQGELDRAMLLVWRTQVQDFLVKRLGQDNSYVKNLNIGQEVDVGRGDVEEYQQILKAVKEDIINGELEVSGGEQIREECLQFWSIIHENVIRVARDKFGDGYYADAVESAFKEVNKRVKEIVKSKTETELDGARLMQGAFSEKNPVIVLDDLSSESGRNIQVGYMQIFAGAMTGIRNPKAHDNITITKERAIHFIFLASLLMHKLDEATY